MNTSAQLFAEIADDAGLGGKARSLARLAAAGLPTPAGFVVTDALFRALCPAPPPLPASLDQAALQLLNAAVATLVSRPLPSGFGAALADRLRALGGDRFAVRSSFADEDRPGALAPGVYESRVGVAADEVEAALRAVLGSALGPGAVAYSRAHGARPAAPPVAVLIHRHEPGTAQGAAAGTAPEAAGVISAHHGTLSDGARAHLHRALATLTAQHGPVEVEWVADGDAVIYLQMRPYQAPAPPRSWPALAQLPAEERTPDWRWDAAHNPRPLSTAHASLVAAVDARCQIGIRQRVLGGYLFCRTDAQELAPAPTTDLAALVAELDRDIEAYRGAPGQTPALAAALAGFFPLYQRIFGQLQPAARAARRALRDFLSSRLPLARDAFLPQLLAGVPSRAALRTELAARHAAAAPSERPGTLASYLAQFGDEAPGWDIALPTYRERPEALAFSAIAPSAAPAPGASPEWQQAARAIRAQLPADGHDDFDHLLDAARAAVAAGEDDDWLYARLQAPVRRAVLALGERLARDGALTAAADAFHLSLDWLLAFEEGQAPVAEASALAARGQAALEAAQRDPPPLPADPGPPSRSWLRGTGTSGRALGQVVHRHGPRGQQPPPDAVLVAVSLLPTELPLLQVAALVTETGGALDHVAAQARERGLPAVVGVAGALAHLPEGALVLVDADRGLVVPWGS